MKFAFRSKKDVCSEKTLSPVGVHAPEKRIRCRKTSKCQLILRDCKHAKFEPRHVHGSRCDYQLMWNKTEAITKENRSEHVKLLAKYFLSGSQCQKNRIKFDNHVVKMNRHGTVDDLTKCMYKHVKLYQKMIKMEISRQRKTSYNFPWRKLKSQRPNIPSDTKINKRKSNLNSLEETSGHLKLPFPEHVCHSTFGKLGHSGKSDKHRDVWVFANSNTNQSTSGKSYLGHKSDEAQLYNLTDQTNTYITCRYHNKRISNPDKPSTLTSINSAKCDQAINRCKYTTGSVDYNLKCVGEPKSECKSMIGIPYSKRFGNINEDHCKVVSELVTDRLFNRHSLEVGLFIQENIMELWEHTNLKLDLAQLCLNSFFFPARNLIKTTLHRNLHQFLSINIFKKESEVRDIFGVKHNIYDRFEIECLVLVPTVYAAIFRHKDLSFLDSLAVVLGSCKEKILVMKINQ